MRALRSFQFVLVLGTLSFALACSNGQPAAPGALPLAPTASSAVAAGAATQSFAQCLQGSGDAGCFGGASMSAMTVGFAPAIAPGAPTNLNASASGNTVVLTWAAPTSGDPVISYIIEAGSGPGLINLANFPTGNALTSFSAAGIPNGTYYVRIRAANAGGLSPTSNEAVLIVGGGGGGCAGPPRSLTMLSQSAGAISFGWLPPTSGSPFSYIIEAGSSPGLSNLVIFETGSTATVFSASGIGAGSYYVRVRSRSTCGPSAPSNEILVFVVGFTGEVQVSVAWDAPSDVDLHVVDPAGEEIYYGNPTSSSGGQLDVDSNPACSIDGRQIENIRWAGRAPGGQYLVRVDYWDACSVAATNYTVTVKNGASTQVFTGRFTGPGDRGGQGSGVFITNFVHAASDEQNGNGFRIRPPQLFTPSAEKLRLSGTSR